MNETEWYRIQWPEDSDASLPPGAYSFSVVGETSLMAGGSIPFFILKFYLVIYPWLCWVVVATHVLSLGVVCCLLAAETSRCSSQALSTGSVVVLLGLGCLVA